MAIASATSGSSASAPTRATPTATATGDRMAARMPTGTACPTHGSRTSGRCPPACDPRSSTPSGTSGPRHLECAASPAETTLVRCRFGDAAAPTSVVVMGDSKAMMLMPAFSAAAREAGWSLVTLLKGSCTPILGTLNSQARALDGGRACRRWRSPRHRLAGRPPALAHRPHPFRRLPARRRQRSRPLRRPQGAGLAGGRSPDARCPAGFLARAAAR